MFRKRLLLAVLCTLLSNPGVVLAYTDPELTPETVTDGAGNVADQDDVITWNTSLPEGKPYHAELGRHSNGVTTILYDIVNGFTELVQPNEPPYDLIAALVGSNFNMSGQMMNLVNFGLGIGICFVLGVLFVVLVPCVGCCFCCCRLCGNCGGKLSGRPRDPRDACWCRAHTTMLMLTSSIIIAGCGVFMFSCLEMGDGFVRFVNAAGENLSDVTTFVDNLAKEIEFIALDGYKFVVSVLKRDLNNIDYLVGTKIKDDLNTAADIKSHVTTIIALANAVPMILSQTYAVNSSSFDFRQHGDELQTKLDTTRNNFLSVSTSGGCLVKCQNIITSSSGDIDMQVDYATQLPDLSVNIELLNIIQDADLENQINKDMADYEKIPELVQNQTKDQVTDMKKSLDGFKDDISKSIESVTGLGSQVESSLGKITTNVGEMTNNIGTYKQYITYGSAGTLVILCVVALLQILGACGAVCYYDVTLPPPDRSDTSHKMGNLLMAAAGLAFMFSWLVMLLVLFPFLVGVVLDRSVCDELTAPDYPMLKSMLDKPDGLLGAGYYLGGMLLQDNSVPLTISDTLTACSHNETAYRALKMEHIVDLNEMTNYSSLGLEDDIAGMQVDFSSIHLLSTWTLYLLDLYKSAINIDYPFFKIVLSSDIVRTDFTTLATSIRSVASDGTTTEPAKSQLLSVAQDLDFLKANEIKNLKFYGSELQKEVDSLEALTYGKSAIIDNVTVGMGSADSYIQANIDAIFNQKLDDYQRRIFSVLDSYVERAKTAVKDEAGGCRPLFNIWSSLIDGALCNQFVLPFNAVWFALGWCVVFLIPSIIYSIKLAKYIRKMQYKRNKVDPEPRIELDEDEEFALSYGKKTRPGGAQAPFCIKTPGSRPPSYTSTTRTHRQDDWEKHLKDFA